MDPDQRPRPWESMPDLTLFMPLLTTTKRADLTSSATADTAAAAEAAVAGWGTTSTEAALALAAWAALSGPCPEPTSPSDLKASTLSPTRGRVLPEEAGSRSSPEQ